MKKIIFKICIYLIALVVMVNLNIPLDYSQKNRMFTVDNAVFASAPDVKVFGTEEIFNGYQHTNLNITYQDVLLQQGAGVAYGKTKDYYIYAMKNSSDYNKSMLVIRARKDSSLVYTYSLYAVSLRIRVIYNKNYVIFNNDDWNGTVKILDITTKTMHTLDTSIYLGQGEESENINDLDNTLLEGNCLYAIERYKVRGNSNYYYRLVKYDINVGAKEVLANNAKDFKIISVNNGTIVYSYWSNIYKGSNSSNISKIGTYSADVNQILRKFYEGDDTYILYCLYNPSPYFLFVHMDKDGTIINSLLIEKSTNYDEEFRNFLRNNGNYVLWTTSNNPYNKMMYVMDKDGMLQRKWWDDPYNYEFKYECNNDNYVFLYRSGILLTKDINTSASMARYTNNDYQNISLIENSKNHFIYTYGDTYLIRDISTDSNVRSFTWKTGLSQLKAYCDNDKYYIAETNRADGNTELLIVDSNSVKNVETGIDYTSEIFFDEEYKKIVLTDRSKFVIVDVNNPSIVNTITPALNQIVSESSIIVPKISVSDIDNNTLTCKYYIDSETSSRDTKTATNTATTQTVSFNTLNISALSEGNHTLRFEVNDGYATSSASVTIRVDKSPPTISTATTTSSYNSITVSGSATDAIAGLDTYPYRYTIGSTVTSWLSSGSYTVNNLSPNTLYSTKFEARDRLGHVAARTQNIYTKAQTPSIVVSNPTSYTLDVSINDSNPAGTQYQITTGGKYLTSTGALTTTPTWITAGSKKITATGLSPNTGYSFAVKARNAQNIETPFSSSASGTTLVAPPGVPSVMYPSATSNSIAIYFTTVTGAQGYDILADGTAVYNVTSPYTHTGLATGTQHTYQVRAKNPGGTSAWSSAYTAWTVPGAPTGLSGAAANNSITVTWSPVQGATGYAVEADGAVVSNITSPYTHSGLLPNTQHTYRVRSENQAGSSSLSVPLTKYTKANIPTGGTTGQITAGSIEASWAANQNPAGTYYALGAFDISGTLVKQNPWTTGLTDTITALSPETTYIIKIKAKNKDGEETDWYQAGTAATLPNPPQAPGNLTAVSEETQITISWGEVTGATKYYIQADGQAEIDLGTSTTYSHQGLTPGTQHTYRVKAERLGVKGEYSTLLTTATKLQAPQNITATADSSSITLNWDEAAGATGYQIEKDGTGLIDIAAGTTTYTDNNMGACELHTYRVKALNSVTHSSWSTTVSKTTLVTPPAAPQGLSAQSAQTYITLSWAPVQGATGYEIKIDGTRTINTGSSTTYAHTGLAPGTQHTYSVRARNAAGKSSWSSTVTALAAPVSPDVPSGLTAQVTDTTIQVSWDTVENAQGYQVQVDGQEEISVSQAVYLHAGLTPGTQHTYRVKSIKDGNLSSWSTTLTAYTLESSTSIPQVPSNINIAAAETQIAVTWDRVPGAESYDIQVDGQTKDNVITDSYTLTGLLPNTTYNIQIRGVNSNGPGAWSTAKTAATLPLQTGIPSVPQNIQTTATQDTIAVTWDWVDGAESYDIQINGRQTEGISVAAYVYGGLSPQTQHTITVRAKNAEGTSEWSSPITISTLPQAPEVPSGITAQAAETSVALAWSAVPGAQTYQVEADGAVQEGITQTGFTHTGLMPGTQHTYRIRAKNEGGTSDWSMQVTLLTTTGEAGVPQNLNAQAQDTALTITWDTVEGAEGYQIEADGQAGASVTQAIYNHTGLTPGTRHTYRVRTLTQGQPGIWSAQITQTTTLAVPVNITAEASGPQITLAWEAVAGADGYHIEIDGKTVEAVTEPVYTHTGLVPGSKHSYRIRAKNLLTEGQWSQAVEKQAASLTYTMENTAGEEFNLVLTAANIKETGGLTVTINYNPAELEVLDICAVTPGYDTGIGLVPGTDINIIQVEEGTIVFTASKAAAPGQMWSGLINSIKFRSKVEGQATITYSIN